MRKSSAAVVIAVSSIIASLAARADEPILRIAKQGSMEAGGRMINCATNDGGDPKSTRWPAILRGWQEAEIERECEAQRKGFVHPENSRFFFVLEFIGRGFGSVDDDVYEIRFFVERRQFGDGERGEHFI